MKPIVRVIGFTSVFPLCVLAGVALYIAMASYPHWQRYWQRFGVLISGPLVWRDMGGGSTTTYTGIDEVPLALQVTRMDVAGGLTAKLTAGLSFYAQVGYQFGVSSGAAQRDGIAGDAGLRYRW